MSHPAIPGFGRPRMVAGGDLSLPVYTSETGIRPLIIIHELPGMSDSFLAFCGAMQAQGFRVYMPLLFKEPGTQMGNRQMARLCLSYEFRRMFGRAGRRDGELGFTRWLLDLVTWVGAENPGRDTGVIGMCLTGGFALATIARTPVSAAVLCQPSYPFFFGLETLGLSPQLRSDIAARGATLPAPCAKGYRFRGDRIARDRHMSGAAQILGNGFERFDDLPGNAHSTLTTDSASPIVCDDVLAFLNARL